MRFAGVAAICAASDLAVCAQIAAFFPRFFDRGLLLGSGTMTMGRVSEARPWPKKAI